MKCALGVEIVTRLCTSASHVLVVDVREEDARLPVLIQLEGVLPVLGLHQMLLNIAGVGGGEMCVG